MTNTRTLDRDCCDYEVYSHGKVIGVFDMPKDEANQLVVKLSKKTGNRIDWHYVGGRVVMKMLPPKASVNSRTLKSRNQREGWYVGKRCLFDDTGKFIKLVHKRQSFWERDIDFGRPLRKDRT